jgi:hypothetical protein
VGLDAEDLAETTDGLIVTIRRSKTDQEGQGRKVEIPRGTDPATCVLRGLEQWRTAAHIDSGPLNARARKTQGQAG